LFCADDSEVGFCQGLQVFKYLTSSTSFVLVTNGLVSTFSIFFLLRAEVPFGNSLVSVVLLEKCSRWHVDTWPCAVFFYMFGGAKVGPSLSSSVRVSGPLKDFDAARGQSPELAWTFAVEILAGVFAGEPPWRGFLHIFSPPLSGNAGGCSPCLIEFVAFFA